MKYLVILLLLMGSIKAYGRHQLYRSAPWYEILNTDESIAEAYEDSQHRPMNAIGLPHSPLYHKEANYTSNRAHTDVGPQESASNKESIGAAVFNVHHFTQFSYKGDQIYIYSPKKNEENVLEPQKWAFYYIPLLQPVKISTNPQWVWIHKNEVRVRLALGTPGVEMAARKAVTNQFDNETVSLYSKFWVVAPLMLDSLSAYIVTASSSVVDGTAPFHIDNPVSNAITFRFACTTNETAERIAHSLIEGDYDIEVSFYFAGMHTVKSNMVSITATQLQSVLSKTIADGGGTNATYIHREQASSFVAKYVANVKKMIYIEDPAANMSLLTNGLEEQFTALFQEGIANSKETQQNADVFGQVWQSSDLNPDRITSEMSKIFTFNQSETEKHSDKMNYYNVNQRKDSSLSVHASLDVRVKTLFVNVGVSASVNYDEQESEAYEQTSHSAVSESDIKKAASQSSIEGEWEGEKFIPKSFKVFKLTDVVDRLQVAVIAKQLLAEKANGAVIRKVGALNSALGSTDFLKYPLIGEVKLYAGVSPPSRLWLVCDGSIVSRSQYPRLFSVIGTQYGEDNDSTTFKLPDLRGRVPIGVDNLQLHVTNAMEMGATGGSMNQTLTVEQLPPHVHDQGTLHNSNDGVHAHNVEDPGHSHSVQWNGLGFSLSSSGISLQSSSSIVAWQSHTPNISTAYTKISLKSDGSHTHQVMGETGTVGQNASFPILPPFQVFQYIIYAGEQL